MQVRQRRDPRGERAIAMQNHENHPFFHSVDYDHASTNYDLSRKAPETGVRWLVRLLNPLTNAIVLDVGCGTANYLFQLKGLPIHGVGLDLSAGMLTQARSKDPNAMLIQANATFMPFLGEAFDAVYCVQAFHHISDRGAFLSEASRLLRNGGRFVIESCSHEQLSTFSCYHYFPRGLDIDRLRIPDLDEILNLLSTAGFRDVAAHSCPIDDAVRDAPEDYLDERNRDGNSTFPFLETEEIEEGCKRIRQDMQSGKTAVIVSQLRRKAEQIGGQISFVRAVKQ